VMAMFGEAVRQGLRDVPRSKNSHFHDFASFRRVNPSGIPQMGPIRAQFWLPSVPLASWTLRNWRKTDRASWYRRSEDVMILPIIIAELEPSNIDWSVFVVYLAET
jgi:hypothetical protein